ncbi:hypothetical protein [Kiloniella sp.]|uniref:hypothetical protein n=1 Tax=Kiloniella sp. TaxID=1938587 RepID=UPI003B0233C8
MSGIKCCVCGWPGLEEDPAPMYDNHDICCCCGTQFGLEVRSVGDIAGVRREWLEEGAPWFYDDDDENDPADDDETTKEPNNWNKSAAEEQIKKAFG